MYSNINSILENENFVIFIAIFMLVITLACIGLSIWIYCLSKKYEKEQRKAFLNLGSPMKLSQVEEKLYLNPGCKFIILSFIPGDSKDNSVKKVYGFGLIAYYKRPKEAVHVCMAFKTTEEILPDSKTLYRIKASGMMPSNCHLEKVA